MYFKINFSKNTTFFSILLIVYLFLFPLNNFGNNIGSPYIQRIILQNYGFSNNNFSILQDFNSIIYIGNSNGIVQYNGKSHSILDLPGVPYMDIDQRGTIYVGTYNDFGFISNTWNKAEFISFKDSISKEYASFGQINRVYTNKNDAYFCSDKILFRFDGSSVSVIEQSDTKISLYKVNNQIYLKKEGGDFFKLVGQQFRLIPHSSFFKAKTIIDILPYNEQILIKTAEDKGFFIFDNYSIEPFKTKADQFIQDNIYSKACALSDGNYAIGTILSGIIIIDMKGEIVNLIDETSGLFSLTINSLYTDQEGNLWALHDQGISRIEIPSAYSYFSKSNGIHGSVNSVIRFKNKLYVATTLGVYFLTDKSKLNDCFECSKFKLIPNIKSNCFDFQLFNNQLFVTTSKGIYEIQGEKAKLFYNRNANEITCVLHSHKNPSYIFLGNKDGFSSIRYSAGILIVEKKLEGIKDKIISITEDKDGSVWLSTYKNGLYKIDSFDKYSTNLSYTHYPISDLLKEKIDWIVLNSLNGNVLFSTSDGIFRYNDTLNTFYKDTLLGIDFTDEIAWIYPIVQDKKGNIWLNIVGKENTGNKTVVKNELNDSLKTFRPLPLNRIRDFYITSIQPVNNDIVWFGGFEGLIRLNLNAELNPKHLFKVFLNKINIGKDSILYQIPFGNSLKSNKKPTVIKYKFNKIRFDFSANDYESEDQILYKYKLEGFDTSWSNWSTANLKEYTNLYEGKYRLRLISKNLFDQISKEESFNFIIKPPFYRTVYAYLLYILTLLLLFILIGKWRVYYFARERFRLENIIHERTEEVVIQKEKADNLLERVLPKNTAKELKSGRKAGPYHYNMVTVLFSDIQGFTKISEQMDSELLIDELDRFFLQFDMVVEKHNIEKIKTIGDAYMCAGGIPVKNRTNPVEVVLAALEMQSFMKELKRTADDSTKHIWDLRIGIDTGPVVAGVLGRSKISYDIWGGTVNTASRMEASSEPGKINITENTYMLIKDYFICQYRGKMPVKYKGEIDMYFVEGFKPHLASDLKGHIPNENFFTQLQMLRVNDVEEFVLSKLEDGLPDNLYYHNVKHTIDVVTQVELIGRSEGVGDEDMLILKTAAVFHDMGHLVNYDTHEEEGVKLAKKILPEYQYTPAQIEKICKLIIATHMPPEPLDLLEEIMCDADLDYLGRTDFVPVSINLYKELAERKKIDSLLEWNQMQIKFIKNHQYFTKTAQKLREVNKKNQLNNIQNEIKRELEMGDE